MSPEQKMVKKFHKACDIPIKAFPGFPNEKIITLRTELIFEEATEFFDACINEDFVEAVDALVDLLYVTYGAALAFGVDIEPIFKEVHRANMTKTSGLKRVDGKQLKPKDFKPPNLLPIIQDQQLKIGD